MVKSGLLTQLFETNQTTSMATNKLPARYCKTLGPNGAASQTPVQWLNGCRILSLFIFSSVSSRAFPVPICGAGAPLFSPVQFQKAKAGC